MSTKGILLSGPLPAPQLSKPPHQPQDSSPTGWWRTNAARIGFIAAVPICGLIAPGLGLVALMGALVALWLENPWSKQGKVVATIAAGALLGAVAPAPAKNGPQGHPAAAHVTPTAAAPSVSAAPVVSRRPLQDFRGQSLEVAYSRITKTGTRVVFHDASDRDEDIKFSSRGLWTVCFQKEAGTGIDAYPTVELGAVHRGDPCPTQDGGPLPLPTMPDLVWKTWPQARAEVVALGVPAERVRARAAYVNDTLPDEGRYEAWRVCAHDPAGGEPIRSNADVTLSLSSPVNGCPESHRGTGAPAMLPDGDDDGDPDYRDPYPSDRNRNRTFPDGLPKDSGDSNRSGGHGSNLCRHTRWC